jgi:hypothetical protein
LAFIIVIREGRRAAVPNIHLQANYGLAKSQNLIMDVGAWNFFGAWRLDAWSFQPFALFAQHFPAVHPIQNKM